MGRVIPVLIVLVVMAGCGSITVDTTHTSTGQSTVTVSEVVDGDTIHIRYANGTTDTVRLLGVDSPETSGETTPTEFEGVPSSQSGELCLRVEAENATGFTTRELLNREVRLEHDPRADHRDRYGRLLAYVYMEGDNFNYKLIASGYARVYDTEFTESDRFYSAETEAQSSHVGVWRCTQVSSTESQKTSGDTNALAIVQIHANADGNDNENLNDEYIVFENTGNETLELGGWTIGDGADHFFVVPDGFSVAPGHRVTLSTGSGTNTAETLYWGSDSAIWNNDGDTVFIYDDSGQLRLEETYSG